MFNNVALDVFIGLTCIFLLYSLLASILMESVAKYLGLRQRITLKAIYKILDDSEFSQRNSFLAFFSSIDIKHFFDPLKDRPLTALFYAHPNIKNLGKNNFNRKPSSITPEMFAETLIQILRGDEFVGQQNQVDLIKTNLKIGVTDSSKEKDIKPSIKVPFYYEHSTYKPVTKRNIENKCNCNKASDQATKIEINKQTYYQLQQLLYNAHSDIDWFKKSLINWHNEMMDRAEGWYIKQTRSILFIIGFIIAIAFNVDTIAIGKKLAIDKAARDKMIEFAATISKDHQYRGVDSVKTNQALQQAFDKANKSIAEANTIIGDVPKTISWNNMTPLLGWILTAFALSLGASFWFDLLGKIMCIRQGGNNSSTDSQKKTDKTLANPTEEPIG